MGIKNIFVFIYQKLLILILALTPRLCLCNNARDINDVDIIVIFCAILCVVVGIPSAYA
jgi:steroid 5-alpha reductase family enzyme